METTLSKINEENSEIFKRLAKVSKSTGSLKIVLKYKRISRDVKNDSSKETVVIRSTVAYASDTWTLNKHTELKSDRWERKILRRIFGVIEEGAWRRRTNK